MADSIARQPRRSVRATLPLWARAALFGLAYFASAELGAFLSAKPSHFEAFWPPSGLAVAVLLLVDYPSWPALALATAVANVLFNSLQGNTLTVVLPYAAISVSEPVVGAWLIRRFVAFRPTLETTSEVIGLAAYSAGVSTALSATIGAGAFAVAYGGPFSAAWLVWWVANALGVLVVAPVVLTWRIAVRKRGAPIERRQLLEAVGLLATLALLSWLVFSERSDWGIGLVYLVLPLLVWMATRFGPHGVAMTGLVVTLIATYLAKLGYGRFARPDLPTTEQSLALQTFLAVTLFTILLLAAAFSERRRAEAEREGLLDQMATLARRAQRQAAELQEILANMVDAVYVCDAAGQITHTNSAGLRLYGLSRLEDQPQSLESLARRLRLRKPDGTPLSGAEMNLGRALRGETVFQNDTVLTNMSTQRDIFVRTSAGPIRNQEGAIVGAVAIARDVSDLIEFDRLKDQFIGVAAHELKTPVTIMKGYSQALLRTSESLAPPQIRMLGAIDRGADRIERIVNDLLDVSRLQLQSLQMAREPVELSGLVREAVERLGATAKRHQIELVNEGEMTILGDRNRLGQVLSNLLDNAVRYSPNGGEVTVTVARREDEVVVSVRDRGVGIPERKQARIFERFYRAHTRTPSDYGGMGVGLYISREIVLQHGGRIWFSSEEGGGSTFSFSLPLANRPAAPPSTASP